MLQQYSVVGIKKSKQGGQIAMAAVIFFLLVILVILGTYGTLAVGQLNTAAQATISKKVYATIESGQEDAARRLLDDGIANPPTDGTSYTIALNAGTTAITSVFNADADALTDDYRIESRGNIKTLFRASLFHIVTNTEDFALSIDGAMQVGYGGLKLGNGSVFGSDIPVGSGQGDILSSGSVNGGSGNPKIDGDMFVSRSIGNIVNQEEDISSTPICTGNTPPCLSLRYSAGGSDGAQSFISSLTAKSSKVELYMRKFGNPSGATLYIRSNKRINSVTGAACASGTNCIDVPDASAGGNIASVAVPGGCSAITTSWGWVTCTFTGTILHTVSNKKYWIVFDAASGTDISNYYIFADNSASDYTYGSNTYYKAESDFCDEGDATPGDSNSANCPFTSRDSMYTSGTFLRFANYTNITSGVEDTAKDIGFRVYLGAVTNSIVGDSAGKFEITGDATAPFLQGVDIDGYAYYGSVTYPPLNANDEVLAGGTLPVYPGSSKTPYTSTCRAPAGSTPASYPSTNYCQCRNEIGTYCNPIVYDEIPDKPMFTYTDGPMPINILFDLKRKVVDSTNIITLPTIDTSNSPYTITAPVKINGDLVIRSGGRLLIDSASNDYTVWVTGKIDVNSTPDLNCFIQPKTRSDFQTNFNLFMITDNTAEFQHFCAIEPFNDPRSYFYVVSTSPRILGENGSAPTDAMSINDTSSGSVFYATRGSVHLENNITVKSVGGHFIDVKDGASLTYEEGIAKPYQVVDGIREFHEIE
ncbi:MAG: hypothetical protein AAB372_03985 [Patescibacteria group bacterium]